jgi:hypothetical protein
MWFDKRELNNLNELLKECVVNYDTEGRVMNTSEGDKPALLFTE